MVKGKIPMIDTQILLILSLIQRDKDCEVNNSGFQPLLTHSDKESKDLKKDLGKTLTSVYRKEVDGDGDLDSDNESPPRIALSPEKQPGSQKAQVYLDASKNNQQQQAQSVRSNRSSQKAQSVEQAAQETNGTIPLDEIDKQMINDKLKRA